MEISDEFEIIKAFIGRYGSHVVLTYYSLIKTCQKYNTTPEKYMKYVTERYGIEYGSIESIYYATFLKCHFELRLLESGTTETFNLP